MNEPSERVACPVSTPLGMFTAIYEGGVIKRVFFPGESPGAGVSREDSSLPFAAQMREYFEGKRKAFSLPVSLSGTKFMRDVYEAAIKIPYGSTASYAGLANAAGYPRAFRAVGSAMRTNPLPILVPCHRVVHKSGGLSRYAGGTGIKRFLLEMEGAVR